MATLVNEGDEHAEDRGMIAEAIAAIVTIAIYLATCSWIGLSATNRLGQISGMASLAFRFTIFAFVLVLILVRAARRDDRSFDKATRLVCASVAGLATAMIASGIMVALHGTPWGLNAQGGDVGVIARWAESLHHGGSIPPLYPPLSIHILHLYSDITHLPPGFAIKHLQILGTAAYGPAAYLAWRMLLKPQWALGIGVVAMLPLMDPYKPYTTLILVIFVPLAIRYVMAIREADTREWPQIIRSGILFGLGFGLLCLLYSGWFQWSAPGLFVATLVVFPWRGDRKKAFAFLGITAAAFLVLAGYYLVGLVLDPSTKIADAYVYFDVKTEPMYIAMWRDDLGGGLGVWPPIGELSGVGLYSILLAAGFGLAVTLKRRSTLVIATSLMMAGAWFMRFNLARKLFATKLVQLYPRTTPLILYCLLILSGCVIYWLVQRAREDSPLRSRNAIIGAVCGLLLFFAFAGSATSDRYMPANNDPPNTGFLAYNAQATERANKLKPQRSRPIEWVRRPRVQGTPPQPQEQPK
jgi:galactan 5-O-arabinofuranosyltransferase